MTIYWHVPYGRYTAVFMVLRICGTTYRDLDGNREKEVPRFHSSTVVRPNTTERGRILTFSYLQAVAVNTVLTATENASSKNAHLPRRPPWTDLHQLWRSGWPRRPDHPWRFFLAIGLRVLNLWGVEFWHFPISRRSPLTRSLWSGISLRSVSLKVELWGVDFICVCGPLVSVVCVERMLSKYYCLMFSEDA